MARSIDDAIREALAAAVQAGALEESHLMSVTNFTALKGGTGERGAQRYYLNGQLNEYVDIGERDIVAELDLAGDASPLVLVLIKPEAKVQHHVDISETVQASFLTGDIAARHLTESRLGDPYFFDNQWRGQYGTFQCSTGCGSIAGGCNPIRTWGCPR